MFIYKNGQIAKNASLPVERRIRVSGWTKGRIESIYGSFYSMLVKGVSFETVS